MRAERKADEAIRAHDFAVIDAAVKGTDAAEPEDAALTSFALAVKSARPEPDVGFVRELDERVERIRGVSAQNRGGGSIWHRRRPQLIAFGCVVALFAVSMSVAELDRGADDSSTTPLFYQGQTDEALNMPTGTAAGDSAAKIAPEQAQDLSTLKGVVADPLIAQRDVIRGASMRIGTGLDDFTDTTDEVVAITDRLGGFVRESTVSDGTAGQPTGEMLLMVPAAKLQQALASISELGTVLERNQSLSDVTASVSRIDRRVSRLRARRAAIAGELADASTAEQRAELRARLRRADTSLSRAVRLQRSLARDVRFSELSVNVEASARRDESSVIANAWETAKSALEKIAAAAIVVLAIGLPFGLLALAVVFAIRWSRRRGRDRAIDSADSAAPQAP